MKKGLLLFMVFVTSTVTLFSQPIYNESGSRFSHSPSQEEMEWAKNQGRMAPFMTPMPPPTGEIRPVAEWEPMEAVLVSWNNNYDSSPPTINGLGVPVDLIKKMSEDVKVITIIPSSSNQTTVYNLYSSGGVNMGNCEFVVANTNSYWTRDYGPWFMSIDNEKVGIFDFKYNRPRLKDNDVNKTLANVLSMNRYESSLVLTGGNYMTDGIKQGFSTTLVLNENSLSEQQIKNQYKEYLGIEQYHFIADPIYPYDNIQHIDCWSKLLAPNKVLVARVPSGSYNYNKFEAAATYFAGLTSSYGTPMEVIRVDVVAANSSSRTPYTNSLILNNKVYVPITGNSLDNNALQVYKDAMPGYEIIGISDATLGSGNKWWSTDALHCRTHEIADRCMLSVQHQPLFGNIENTGVVNFSAEVYSYCNNAMVSDSVLVYVKTGGAYIPYNMVQTENNIWTANVTGLPSGEVKYYIFAKDVSGRRECHPYIGGADPHKFTLTGTVPELPILEIDKIASSVSSESFAVIEDYITISNVGTADLTFDVTDVDFPDMLTVTPLVGTVQPDGSQTITLSYDFAGVENGTYTGSFKLSSNDPVNPEIEVTLQAIQNVTEEIPVLVLDKTESSVTSEGEVVEDMITASNVGNAELTFEITDIDFPEILTIAPLNGTIQAGDSQVITLTYDFMVAKATEYTGSFKLLSNDPLKPETEISLYAVLTVGINDVKLSTIYIYPNPTRGEFRVSSFGFNTETIEIFDVMGRKVSSFEFRVSSSETTIDVSHLPSGVYFIKIEGHAFKFIKQ